MVTLEKDSIAALQRAVERRLGHGVNSPSEFKRLSEAIDRSSGKVISTSTLMRLWGYVSSTARPSIATLNALSLYAGYHDFASFSEGSLTGSHDVVSAHLNVERDLNERDHVVLRWQPGRECLLRYLGSGQWVVERSERTKLAVGDTFTCHLMIAGEPLYLDNLVHKSMPPRCYVCGQRNGVQYEVLRAEEACDNENK